MFGYGFDWQEGMPPIGVPVYVWKPQWGCNRRGMSDGVWFRFDDCTHPMQNAVMSLEEVGMWSADPSKATNQKIRGM